jgi:CBS domain-containing protein
VGFVNQIESYMKTSQITVDSDVLLFDAEQLMIKRKTKCFVVTEGDNVVRLLKNV